MNKYDWFVIVGLILWLVETALFGWNMKPLSVPEKMFDLISQCLIIYGAIAGIAVSLRAKVVININNPEGTISGVKE